MKLVCEDPIEVAKEIFWLAYQASDMPHGMGILRANPNATKDAVWESVSGQTLTDYAAAHSRTQQSPYADYVFGRMMKLSIKILSDGLELSDNGLDVEYQSWCRRYPTYASLCTAAVANLARK